MKTTIFTLLLCGWMTAALAQFTFGPELGINSCMYTGTEWSRSAKGGLRAGLTANEQLRDCFSAQVSVYYVNNGYLPPLRAGGGSKYMSIHTIEVPASVVYKLKHKGTSAPYFTVGPYAAFNVGGRADISGGFTPPYPRTDEERTLRIGAGSNNDIRQLDMGVSTSIGVQFDKGMFLRLLVHKGFVNLCPDNDAGNVMHNFNLGLTLGYCFGNKSHRKGETKKSAE